MCADYPNIDSFNTSYVSVQAEAIKEIENWSCGFNTSYVSVQEAIKGGLH